MEFLEILVLYTKQPSRYEFYIQIMLVVNITLTNKQKRIKKTTNYYIKKELCAKYGTYIFKKKSIVVLVK